MDGVSDSTVPKNSRGSTYWLFCKNLESHGFQMAMYLLKCIRTAIRTIY